MKVSEMSEGERSCYINAVSVINNATLTVGTSNIQRACKVGYSRACDYIKWAVENKHVDINQLNANAKLMVEKSI